MPAFALNVVADVVRGVSFDKSEVIDEPRDGYLPVLRAGNIDVDLLLDRDLVWVPERRVGAEQRMRAGDIAICMSSGSEAIVGKTATLRGPWLGSVGAFCAIVRPKPNVALAEYVSLFLQSEGFRTWTRKSSGANIKNIRKSELESFPVPVPPLDEQRRIVDILLRAEGIVRLRREAETLAAAVVPALFVDMFGSPMNNTKAWPLRKVSDFVARLEGGKNLLAGSEGGTAFRILKISAVTRGTYNESESKATPNEYSPPASHIVRVGDLLFSRANTAELVGATAIVESTDGRTLLPDKLWRFVWSEPVEPRYMHALFQNRSVRVELGKLSSGTSASMRNISQGKLYALRLPVAPLERQAAFARRAESMLSVLAQQSAARHRAEATFRSLLSRAFTRDGQQSETGQPELETA